MKIEQIGPYKFRVSFRTDTGLDVTVATLELHDFWERLSHPQRVQLLSQLSTKVMEVRGE